MADVWIAPPTWPNPPPPNMPITAGTQPITISTVATIPQLPNPVWPPPYVPPEPGGENGEDTEGLSRMSDNGREPPPAATEPWATTPAVAPARKKAKPKGRKR